MANKIGRSYKQKGVDYASLEEYFSLTSSVIVNNTQVYEMYNAPLVPGQFPDYANPVTYYIELTENLPAQIENSTFHFSADNDNCGQVTISQVSVDEQPETDLYRLLILKLYPNPVKNELVLKIGNETIWAMAELFNPKGQEVFSEKCGLTTECAA